MPFIGICNPNELGIRIFNPIIALQMLIINAAGWQIRPNEERSDNYRGYDWAVTDDRLICEDLCFLWSTNEQTT